MSRTFWSIIIYESRTRLTGVTNKKKVKCVCVGGGGGRGGGEGGRGRGRKKRAVWRHMHCMLL